MSCLKCDKDELIEEIVLHTAEVKDQTVEVTTPCLVCVSCKSRVMNAAQMDIYLRASADKYRELNNLLTSSQIRAYREGLGMSQTAFARYINVGEASIKRWEGFHIQDSSQDDHIRLKCDEAYAESNYLDVHWKHQPADIFSGKRTFNLQIFKQVVLFLVKKTKESIIYLNKLHFYVDFLHFQKTGESLTGARYSPLKYGPCPDQYRAIYSNLVRGGYLKEHKDHSYEALIDPDLTLFDALEMGTLKSIYKLYQSDGAQKIYELSHKEKGYVDTPECTFINYEYAKDLLIKNFTKPS